MAVQSVCTCDRCQRQIQPKQGVILAGAVHAAKASFEGSPTMQVMLGPGMYCWNCLFHALEPWKHDPDCEVSRWRNAHSEAAAEERSQTRSDW